MVLTFLILLAALMVVFTFSSNSGNRVTPNELQAYAIEFSNEYSRLSVENAGLANNIPLTVFNSSFFEMHWYTIQGIISETHGAAISFDPSMKNPSNYKVISQPIEYYFWSNMAKNTKGLPIVYISEGVYPLDKTITVTYGLTEIDPQATVRFTTTGATFNFSNNAGLIVFGTLIEKHSLLLKGSNNKEDWSITQADLDALDEFTWDLKSANVTASSIQQLDIKYEVPFLLSKISSRMANGDYRNNPAIFYSDYEQLKEIAAGTMNGTLTNVLSDFYSNQQKSEPSFGSELNNFLTQNAVGVVIISLLSSFIGAVIGYLYRAKSGKQK